MAAARACVCLCCSAYTDCIVMRHPSCMLSIDTFLLPHAKYISCTAPPQDPPHLSQYVQSILKTCTVMVCIASSYAFVFIYIYLYTCFILHIIFLSHLSTFHLIYIYYSACMTPAQLFQLHISSPPLQPIPTNYILPCKPSQHSKPSSITHLPPRYPLHFPTSLLYCA